MQLLMQHVAAELAGDYNRVFTKNEAIFWFCELYPTIKGFSVVDFASVPTQRTLGACDSWFV